MTAHLTRRINAPYRCSLKTLLFCINLDWKLSFLISKLIWTRSIFIPVVHKVNGKLQGFFHHEAMLHGEMSGGRAPLGAAGDLSEQYFFFGEAFLFLTRKRNGSNTLLCNNKIFYMGSYIKKIYTYHKYIIIQKISFENSLFR